MEKTKKVQSFPTSVKYPSPSSVSQFSSKKCCILPMFIGIPLYINILLRPISLAIPHSFFIFGTVMLGIIHICKRTAIHVRTEGTTSQFQSFQSSLGNINGGLILSTACFPTNCSTIVKANKKAVPGPLLVMTFWSTTTRSSEYRYTS